MYMNEKLVPEAMKLSNKIQLVTRFRLYHERYASKLNSTHLVIFLPLRNLREINFALGENFQIMNYGIGGKISGHVDSRGEIIDVNNTVSDNINGK